MFRVIGKGIKALGLFPTGPDTNILTSGDLTCTIEDKLTGQTMAQFEQCKCSEQSFDVSARGLTSLNLNFVTIRVKDESEIPV